MYDVVIIGAGVAGISAALRLRKRGLRVLVLEKNAYVGGKMHQITESGYRWDTGPSLFTVPELVNELYDLFGEDFSEYYNYQSQNESCRYFFNDSSQLTFYTDKDKLKKEIEDKTSTSSTAVFEYLENAKKKYDGIGTVFLENAIHKISELPMAKLIKIFPQLLKTNLLGNLHDHNTKSLKDEKLVQIFDRYATYNGSNPYSASGILSMIPHLEQNIGTYFPLKGMKSIVNGLFTLAQKVGVDFLFNQNVEVCCKKSGKYMIKTTNSIFEVEKLICAIDHLQFYKSILKDEKMYDKYARQERSSSAVVFYWGIKKCFEKLGLHNIIFSEDYSTEFNQIFSEKSIPDDPTVYIHISSKVNKCDAPKDCENWFVMVNVPSSEDFTKEQVDNIRRKVINKVNKTFDICIEDYIENEHIWNPEKIASDTGALQGALYGAASNKKLSAITRHPNFSKKYKDLYFCGGTVHPGGGIPLSIQSAKIVDKLISNEH